MIFRKTITVATVLSALLLCGGGAAAESSRDSGIWSGSMGYTLALGSNPTTTIGTQFIGAYSAGRFTEGNLGGDFRLLLGTSDSLTWNGAVIEADLYALDLGSSMRMNLDRGLSLRISGGADCWWGHEDGSLAERASYLFIQAKAGAGLVRSVRRGAMTLETSADAFLTLDYIKDKQDFGGSYLLQGLQGSLAADLIFAVVPDFNWSVGVRGTLGAEQGFFSSGPQTAYSQEIATWLGVAWEF